MYKLFYCPGTASMAPQRSPDYLVLNPNGRVPTLVDGNLVLFDSAAICLHLCDRHPAAGLAPDVGTAERAEFYKWLIWPTNMVQPDMLLYINPQRYGAGDVRGGRGGGALLLRGVVPTAVMAGLDPAIHAP
ncbi:MAG TPA: glutathione S-transferase N-terminal domain-containing protein [Azospirillaceae bacterium]|nr:glutathione S-transferase N-terminal domain-containing protein [Azospirillaceae bacterium]